MDVCFNYDTVFPEIRTGDLLAYSGRGPLHLGVRLWEWLEYRQAGVRGRPLPKFSHVGMALWVNNSHLFIVEQEVFGCRMIPLRKSIKKFNGDVYWYSLRQDLLVHQMAGYALDAVFDRYGYRDLLRTFLFNDRNLNSPAYCSGLYRALLKAGGYDWGDWDPMPDELVELPCLACRGQLVVNNETIDQVAVAPLQPLMRRSEAFG